MSSVLDDLSTMLSGPNPDLTSASGRHDAAKKLEEVQSAIYDCFDNTMAASKGFTATYHSMLETHKVCAQLLGLCLALSQPNSVSVQRILAQKAQIELDMIEMVSTQSRTMQIIQLLHDCSEWIIWDRLSLYN